MRFNVLYITVFFIPWFNEKFFQPYFDCLDNTYTGFARSTAVIWSGSSVVGHWQSLVDSRRYVRFRTFFSKACLVSLRDLPIMIMSSFSSLKLPLQCPGGFSPLNKVRQREICRWKIRRTRYAPESHLRGKFPQQAFLDIEGY